jgi:hypothetical protein
MAIRSPTGAAIGIFDAPNEAAAHAASNFHWQIARRNR